ncbi:MAG: cysteine--tRNA ligase [Bacillota bacterium]|jgi:cysteinyl-tRNA synthetase
MAIMVYNTLSRNYEEFKPLVEGEAKLYVCGITPYASSHIGHARPAVFWDVVRRYLIYQGYKVTLVTNFTDIEDKLIRKSKETGIPLMEIAEKYALEYIDSMDKLGVQRANAYPRASQVIPDIIKTVEVLVEKGFAYEAAGDVYFRAGKFAGYGKLSGRNTEDLMPGARVQVSKLKESPLDWALWKVSPDNEPGWESPWGRGRPGWHIECSVMVNKYLGPSIDMHGGGTELVFPHHENEIAQAEAFSGIEPYVKYWIHNEMLNLEGEKMSKSIGNVVSLSEVLQSHDPMAVRLYLLSAHRRKILEFSQELLKSAEKGWERIQTGYANALEFLVSPEFKGLQDPSGLAEATEKCQTEFFEAMDNDFGTPGAIAAVFDLISAINGHVVSGKETTSDSSGRQQVAHAFGLLVQCLGILGLAPKMSQTETAQGNDITEDLLNVLIDLRNMARQEKDYKTADYIRNRMTAIGISVEDTPSGTRVKRTGIGGSVHE